MDNNMNNGNNNNSNNNNTGNTTGGNNSGENKCSSCGRPESSVGRLIHLPNNMNLCQDCMRRSVEMIGNMWNEMNPDIMGFGSPKDFQEKEAKKEEPKTDFDADDSIIEMLKDFKSIPMPHEIKAMLDDYVIGQDKAKKVLSVAVYNHYKRLSTRYKDSLAADEIRKKNKKLTEEEVKKMVADSSDDPFADVELEKSNILMLGPTGSGKTYLVKTLAQLLKVPIAIADATTLTEAGYIGDDVESVVSKLLTAAGGDVFKTECGIVFVDEIDKIARKADERARDIRGESVQQAMLKLLEGSKIEVSTGGGKMSFMAAMGQTKTIDTSNILFICGGAFSGLDEVIKKRLTTSASIGFNSDLKDAFDHDDDILQQTTTEDLREYGMIPEFIGRLPIMYALHPLDRDMLVRILKEPKNSIVRQYQKLFNIDGVKLEFSDSALEAIADQALKKKTGARALRSIIEALMTDLMYEIPKDRNIGRVIIDEDFVNKKGGPKVEMRDANMLGGPVIAGSLEVNK